MIELSPAGRAGTPDEVATVGAPLIGPDSEFNTASDFLMDGGVNLPAPEIIAADITADLEAALEQFATIAEDLK